MWQQQWQHQPKKKTVTFNDKKEIRTITEEEWTLVENNTRPLNLIDHHPISEEIARSISLYREVQCYQEGVTLHWQKFTWEQFKELDNQFLKTEDRDDDWHYDWRGPNRQCWCHKKLYQEEHKCQKCHDDLAKWITILCYK